jgi:TPR repeat protein
MTSKELEVASLRIVRVRAKRGEIAAQSELARRLARRKKDREALAWFRLAARSGDPERQMELGMVLCWDHAAYREGLQWIRDAARQDHMGAQYFLGAELATGENVAKKPKEAAYWYRRAAMRGHAEAQYNLATMYWEGEGVKRSAAAAHKWLAKAARSRDLVALQLLADAHASGLFGYRKNSARARYWRRLYDRARQMAAPCRDPKQHTTLPPVKA